MIFAAIRARVRQREMAPSDEDGTDKAVMALVVRRMLERVPT
jgi:hypothetical protein